MRRGGPVNGQRQLHAIIPPLSLRGPVLTIRKFSQVPLAPRDLVELGSMGPRMLEFLAACVRARMNVIVSGGTGSGKTTMLGVLSGFIPEDDLVRNALRMRPDRIIAVRTVWDFGGRGRVATGTCRWGSTKLSLTARARPPRKKKILSGGVTVALMSESEVATRAEVLKFLSEAARKGNVPAMRMLLDELGHDDGDPAVGSSVIDDIATKRKTPRIVS